MLNAPPQKVFSVNCFEPRRLQGRKEHEGKCAECDKCVGMCLVRGTVVFFVTLCEILTAENAKVFAEDTKEM